MPNKEHNAEPAAEEVEGQEPETQDAENSEGNEPEENASHNDNQTDYEAMLKREKEAREKAEKALASQRWKDNQKKKQEEDYQPEVEEDEENRPLTAKELQNILAKERQENQKLLKGEKIEGYIDGLTSDNSEKDLIREIHQSTTFPSHWSLKEQVESAFVIANKDKLVSERNEALRALKNGGNASKTAPSSYRDEPVGPSLEKLSGPDEQAIKQAGFSYNDKARRYEKKLSNGKTLVRDPKTKHVTVVG